MNQEFSKTIASVMAILDVAGMQDNAKTAVRKEIWRLHDRLENRKQVDQKEVNENEPREIINR